eukprot:12053-Karenia_brevis.AAC.1
MERTKKVQRRMLACISSLGRRDEAESISSYCNRRDLHVRDVASRMGKWLHVWATGHMAGQ